jgi:hypothetical protein
MTAQAQQEREKTWLEKLDEFLVDEFHHGLYRLIGEAWPDVMVGAWHDPLNFFQCLDSEHQFIVANQNKPAHLASHLQRLNFSGKEIVGGIGQEFFQSQLPCNRQKIFLLHSLRLILQSKDGGRVNLSLITPIIRREIHQSMRLVFLALKTDSSPKALEDFTDWLDQYEWQEVDNVRRQLTDCLISWLEQQGIERKEVDDFGKLWRFQNDLFRHISYQPHHGKPVDFRYGHVFSDWQKARFVGTITPEIQRLGSLVSLERLSHEHLVTNSSQGAPKAPAEDPDRITREQMLTQRRLRGGTQYQNLLAIHYLLESLKAKDKKTKRAKFGEFLTGFSENTLRQSWSNIHRKADENGTAWEDDMKLVRRYFEELGLSDAVRLIDNDLSTQSEV